MGRQWLGLRLGGSRRAEKGWKVASHEANAAKAGAPGRVRML